MDLNTYTSFGIWYFEGSRSFINDSGPTTSVNSGVLMIVFKLTTGTLTGSSSQLILAYESGEAFFRLNVNQAWHKIQ